MGQGTIALLYGQVGPDAPADEKDVLVQVETVRDALQSLGYSTTDVAVSLDLGAAAAALRSAGPLLAFNLTESIDGKGSLIHLVPSLLEEIGIPCTGAPAEAIFLTSHKLLAKRILAAGGIDTPPFVTAARALESELPLAFPVIVKSVWEHASIGLEDSAVAHSKEELAAEIHRRSAAERTERLFVERFIEGRELNLALLGGQASSRCPQVLPPAEIQFVDYPRGKPRFVGYRAKWDEGSFEYGKTPRRFEFPPGDEALLDTLRRKALACWELFDLRGYARVDFRVDEEGRPWVLEVNANPCLSPDAGFMAAAGSAGLSRDEVIRRIIADVVGSMKKESDAWAPR